MHDQPDVVAFMAVWPQAGEQGGVFCKVDGQFSDAESGAFGFQHHHGAADFHGDAGVGDGQAAVFSAWQGAMRYW